jgi:hypothetical protein
MPVEREGGRWFRSSGLGGAGEPASSGGPRQRPAVAPLRRRSGAGLRRRGSRSRPAAPRMSALVQIEATRSGSRLRRAASMAASWICARRLGPPQTIVKSQGGASAELCRATTARPAGEGDRTGRLRDRDHLDRRQDVRSHRDDARSFRPRRSALHRLRGQRRGGGPPWGCALGRVPSARLNVASRPSRAAPFDCQRRRVMPQAV